MASKFARIRERLLTCCICLTDYTDPRILPCFHSLCYKCIAGILDHQSSSERERSFQCPQCRKEICVPPGGIHELPNSCIIADLQEILGTKEVGAEETEVTTPSENCDIWDIGLYDLDIEPEVGAEETEVTTRFEDCRIWGIALYDFQAGNMITYDFLPDNFRHHISHNPSGKKDVLAFTSQHATMRARDSETFRQGTKSDEALTTVFPDDCFSSTVEEGEITLKEGDIITDIDQIDEDRWLGNTPDGSYGTFPATFVQLME